MAPHAVWWGLAEVRPHRKGSQILEAFLLFGEALKGFNLQVDEVNFHFRLSV